MTHINPETSPDKYRHWKLTFDGSIATLALDVDEDGGLFPGYQLKLNSYDLGVDLELADAIERIRFEHPEVRTVILTSAKERLFCAGANIFMLGQSSHNHKVNFCKFTNETRVGIEDASANSGLKFLAAVNGPCAGGGYELALACDEIHLVDDGSSTVSLPEVPLLAVLPGTGGLTRVVDKRKVRRDLADFFATTAEGVRGKRAADWGLVDRVTPTRSFMEKVRERAGELAEASVRRGRGAGIHLAALSPEIEENIVKYQYVTVDIDRVRRSATLTLRGPEGVQPSSPEEIVAAGSEYWPLKAFRELDHALLHLRLNEYEIGLLLLKTSGDAKRVLDVDAMLLEHKKHWLVNEIVHFIKRTLKRLDYSARSLVALIEPESCFAGTLLELALAADRSYMLDDPEHPTSIRLSPMNVVSYPMGNGLSRLETRFLANPDHVAKILSLNVAFDASRALELGMVTFAPDDLDWEDEIRLAIEERASMSPDALTGLEANLRFAGPETLETKIFGRLTAWQNWIFQRPNAVGESGALKLYGKAGARPAFDWKRV